MVQRGAGEGGASAGPSVLILIGTLAYGGAENQASLLAAALPARGIRTRVACFGAEPGRREEMAAAGVGVDLLPVGGRLWWPLRVGPHILGLVRRHRIDLVQAFLPSFDILAPLLRLARPGLRVVTSRRNVDEAIPPRQLRLIRLTSRLSQAVVGNSAAVAASVRRLETLREERLRVIPNGMVLPPALAPAERAAGRRALGLGDDDLVVLYLAHFREGKGHRHLPEVVRLSAEREPRARFVVVGDMTSNSRYRRNAEAFRAAVDAAGVAARVLLPGLTSETRPLYAAADVVLNLSDHEGMSNVIMEAMGAGLPVVATATGAASELVRDGREGFVIPCGDAVAAAERLLALFADPALRRRLGEAGRERMARDYGVDRMADAYARLYRELLAAHGTE